MNYTMTVTSKNQVTIPVEVARLWGITKGHKITLTVDKKRATIEPSSNVVEQLYGSVKVSKKLQKMPVDQAIEIAKMRYFKKKGL